MAGNGRNQPQELLVAACLTIITCSVAVVIEPAIVSHFVRARCAVASKRGYPCCIVLLYFVDSRGKLEVLGWSGLTGLVMLYIYRNEFRPFCIAAAFC